MFMEDKKKTATIIVSKKRPNGEQAMAPTALKPEIVKKEGGEVDPRHLAAEDVLAAMHERSAAKLVEALGNFNDLHSSVDPYKGADHVDK